MTRPALNLLKIHKEIEKLIDFGIDEQTAKMMIYHKYNMEDALAEVRREIREEQELLQEEIFERLKEDEVLDKNFSRSKAELEFSNIKVEDDNNRDQDIQH